jgi:hypothetical protein
LSSASSRGMPKHILEFLRLVGGGDAFKAPAGDLVKYAGGMKFSLVQFGLLNPFPFLVSTCRSLGPGILRRSRSTWVRYFTSWPSTGRSNGCPGFQTGSIP